MTNTHQFTSLACTSILMATHTCTHILHVVPKHALPQLCDAAPHGDSTTSSMRCLPQAMCRSCALQQKKKGRRKKRGGRKRWCSRWRDHSCAHRAARDISCGQSFTRTRCPPRAGAASRTAARLLRPHPTAQPCSVTLMAALALQ